MNIKKELEDFESSVDFGDNLLEKLKVQEEEARKKRYLMRVIAFTKQFENLVATDLFKNAGIEFIRIQFDSLHRKSGDTVYVFNFDFADKNNAKISMFVDEEKSIVSNEYRSIEKLCYKFFGYEGLPNNLVNAKIEGNGKYTLEFKTGISEKLLELLLSSELKHIYDYNKMQIDIPDNNNKNDKKMKI